MCDQCKPVDEVRNIYKDEQDKIEDRFQIELELAMKIADLLDMYQYDIDAVLDSDGNPEIQLIRRI